MDTHAVELDFLGQKVTLKSEGEKELIEDAVRLAERKIFDAQKRTVGAPAHHIALLALVDLAEEYTKAKKRATDWRADMTERSDRLLSLVTSTQPH